MKILNKNKFVTVCQYYFALIRDTNMITAAKVIANAYKIILAGLEPESDITRRLLEVPKIVCLMKCESSK